MILLMITGMLYSNLLMREIVLDLNLRACTRLLIMYITVIIRIINIHVHEVIISKNGKQVMCFIFAKL